MGNSFKIGKYFIILPDPASPHDKPDSVYIYNADGEGGELKIEKLEKLIDKLFEEEL